MDDPLLGARLKIERARQHLESLQHETRVFTDSNPYRTVIEPDPETGDQVVRIRLAQPERRIPLRLGLIAGDAIHCLRSALDHLAWQLAVIGDGPDRFTRFPLFDDAHEYRRQEHRVLHGIVKGHRARIEALQPYHVKVRVEAGTLLDRGDPRITNVALMAIGRLDNADKHRLILPITSIAAWREPKFKGVKRATGTYPGEWVRVEDGAELFRVTEWEMLPGATKVNVERDTSFTILFGDPEYDVVTLWRDRAKAAMSGADLNMAADHVQSVIDSFAPDFV